MTAMNYADALKKVQASKPKDNYLLLNLSYNRTLVLPYKDGTTVLAALSQAEQMDDSYGTKKHIQPMDSDAITVKVLSGADYVHHKVAALLNVTFDEAKAAERAANEPTTETTP